MQNKNTWTLLACVALLAPLAGHAEPINPIKDFPTVGTTAKPGEFVLAPSYNWVEDMSKKGMDKVTFIFYNQKMDTPGEGWSKVAFSFTGVKEVPNYLVVPIAAGGKAKKGDVLLTWWQSGSGMKRAYVVDAKDPAEPVVRYLDISYDNPAKHKGVGIGQMEEKLKPNSFVKLSKPGEVGTVVACMSGTDYRRGQVISAAGNKLLTIEHAGRMAVYDKAKCQALDLVPKLKVGDKVQIPWVGKFINATVKKVDPAIGRVFAEYSIGSKTETDAVAYGDVATKLVVSR